MTINQITKCDFERVYQNYAPSKLEKIFYKYFSVNTFKKHKWAPKIAMCVLIIPFLMSFIGTVINSQEPFIIVSITIFSICMLVYSMLWLLVWVLSKFRTNKIQKKLGITNKEYEYLLDKFYNEDLNKYIKNKICEI
jgi:hypothetical protein